jgi:hypothetical protein
MDFSPAALRAHFKALTAKREKIDVHLDPLRAELDALVAGDTKLTVKKAKEREAVIREEIKNLQAKLFPIENERAAVARALGGKTGEPE